jgi:integrase
MGITPEKAVEKAIDSSDSIGEVTKKNYKLQFANLVRLAGGSATAVFRSPEKVYEAMVKEYPSPLTRRALLTVARSIIKLLPDARSKFPMASDKYAQLQRSDAGIASETSRLMDGKMSDRERETYVPWDVILKARDNIEREDPTSEQALLLGMYTYIEPVRQDYGNVKLLKREPANASSIPNFLVLDESDKDTATLTISDYKTAKKYGVHKRHLPKELVEIIWNSLEARPRDFLFVDSKGQPFVKKNSFAKWTNRSLESIFEGRRVTINTLRHSYISNLDFNARTPGDLLRSAKMMGHSVNQQQLYRRLPQTEDSEKRDDAVGKIERKTGPTKKNVDRVGVEKHDNRETVSSIPNRIQPVHVQPPAPPQRGIVVERISRMPPERQRVQAKWVERGSFVVNL